MEDTDRYVAATGECIGVADQFGDDPVPGVGWGVTPKLR